ncbi:hypothetical protein [Isoalcanivorax beigongshangi]|uniref:Uncharacterized protein n=1 Tax=Isoalcanivorax beigongshangi TaxID=3238810 RepID=A0ABV4AFC3_9GAMM
MKRLSILLPLLVTLSAPVAYATEASKDQVRAQVSTLTELRQQGSSQPERYALDQPEGVEACRSEAAPALAQVQAIQDQVVGYEHLGYRINLTLASQALKECLGCSDATASCDNAQSLLDRVSQQFLSKPEPAAATP